MLFWIGACISNTGNWTENAAQNWAVTSQTVGNPYQGLFVELLQFVDFCPVLVPALLAGAISNRVNRKTWLIILQTVAGVFGAGLAVAAWMWRATPVVVIEFTFLEGIVWPLNGPVVADAEFDSEANHELARLTTAPIYTTTQYAAALGFGVRAARVGPTRKGQVTMATAFAPVRSVRSRSV